MIAARTVRRIALATLVLLGGAISFYLLRSPRYEFSAGRVRILDTDADLQIDRLHVVQNAKGVKDWELWADTAKVYKDEDKTHMTNLRIRFYPPDKKTMDVTADRGWMENKTRNMYIFGNVLLRTSDGYTLETQSLRFNSAAHQVDTDDPIVLHSRSFRLTGVGLHGRTDLGRFFLNKNVRAVIHRPEALASGPLPAGKSAPGSEGKKEGAF